MVNREGLVDKLEVTADGSGQVGHAGSALLAGVADRVGLTRALSEATAPTRERRSAHDPGVVLRDLAVMLADGGSALADLGAPRDQPDLFGEVPSDSTAFRVIDSIDAERLERLREAVALARGRAWKLGVRPGRGAEESESEGPELTVIDVDATLTTAHSDKEEARGNFKRGYGHHPLLCYLDGTGEAPAGILRPGNAGSNTASDHTKLVELALEQLDERALDGEILVRCDGAGASHELTGFCREGNLRFSVGFDLTHRGHARVEDRIREGKDCGLSNLPFRSFAHNQVWLWLVQLAQDLIAWTKQLCLAEQARAWELKRLRYRLLHQSGRLARHARRRVLRLARDWPWAEQLATAFARLQVLPAPAG